eukprot:1142103-Pelagomonas_calceolata.AAC.4
MAPCQWYMLWAACGTQSNRSTPSRTKVGATQLVVPRHSPVSPLQFSRTYEGNMINTMFDRNTWHQFIGVINTRLYQSPGLRTEVGATQLWLAHVCASEFNTQRAQCG